MVRSNVGRLDRLIRLVVGAVLVPAGLLALGGAHGRPLGLVVACLGLANLMTGASRFCVLYVPFGVSTVKASDGAPPEER